MTLAIDFTGRTVVITGGTRGIGAAMAEVFSAAGADLVLTGTDPARVEAMNAEAPTGVRYVAVDLADDASLAEFCEFLGGLERLDALVNNAGVNKVGEMRDYDLSDFDRIQAIDLRAPWVLTKAAGSVMADAGYGRIVNVASMYGVITRAGRSAYTTAKSGLIGMTKTAAVELAPHGVLVNALSPGFVVTDMTRGVLGEAEMERMAATVPAQRMAQPEEIARVAAFLASDLNSYMTGQNIIVDGGYVDV